MKTMIGMTFLVLGWAWFELSGGADFEAGDRGVTIVARYQPDARMPASEQEARPAVARAETDLGLTPTAPQPRIRVVEAPVLAPKVSAASPQAGADKLADVAQIAASLDDAESGVVLGGLGGDMSDFGRPVGVDAAVRDALGGPDYRVVTGARVNLRDGPGTGFAVVTTLSRGQEVEVVQDTGDGWVELRALEGGFVGWMADSFLVAAN
ncbi:SH3 domain-containing protein [Thetidibacter halocola]|uniref:SH3 domain-containing protein n=1 Tax=Thetidibacter halocola TaxID=2827239 RepID=A0A8J8B7L5_9RHOB|nr:SH3 domain-containing protein [Thetidibacter halocola]MBS0123829.1 SH3 domain-containing protein [Thetidibacter halocola]